MLSRAPTAAPLLGMWVLGADHFLATNSPPGRNKSASQVVTRKSNFLFVSFYSLQLTPLRVESGFLIDEMVSADKFFQFLAIGSGRPVNLFEQ